MVSYLMLSKWDSGFG